MPSSLTDLIRIIPPDSADSPEDIFASAPGLIFTDDLRNLHGDPDSTIIYQSGRFGDIELRTADPESEDERRLFSHHLWNAGILLAELISGEGEANGGDGKLSEGDGGRWGVEGETVLELGAGVGLTGIVATLAGAREVAISDYPAPIVLANIRRNAKKAIPKQLDSVCRIQGHEWGVFSDAFAEQNAHRFTRILAADCYWMPAEHTNLARSMLHFLTLSPDGRVFAIAGFHTGRAKLACFFDAAVEEGLDVEEIYEEDHKGFRREWAKERDGGREDPTGRKRWLVVAILKRRRPLSP